MGAMIAMTCRPAGAKEGLRKHAAGWSGYHARQHATDTRAGQTANDSTLVVSQKRSFNHEVACQQSIEQVRQSTGERCMRGRAEERQRQRGGARRRYMASMPWEAARALLGCSRRRTTCTLQTCCNILLQGIGFYKCAIAGRRCGDGANMAGTRRASGWRRAGRRRADRPPWSGRACSGWRV